MTEPESSKAFIILALQTEIEYLYTLEQTNEVILLRVKLQAFLKSLKAE